MTFALRKQAGNFHPQIAGADFSHAMLQRARSKPLEKVSSNGKFATPSWIEADALCLPFPDNHFSLVTSAFGSAISPTTSRTVRDRPRSSTRSEFGILDFSEPRRHRPTVSPLL